MRRRSSSTPASFGKSQHHNPRKFKHGVFSKTKASELARPTHRLGSSAGAAEFEEWLFDNAQKSQDASKSVDKATE